MIKLTRNKILYNADKRDTFYDRIIIFFFHLGFLLKEFKKSEDKENLQKFFDFCVRQIELSIREIGYGDATINKKMKDYVNLLFSIIDNIDSWDSKNEEQKISIIKNYVDENSHFQNIVDYFEKYVLFLRNNTFNNLTKDILSL